MALNFIQTEFLAIDTIDEMKKTNRTFSEAYEIEFSLRLIIVVVFLVAESLCKSIIKSYSFPLT